MENKTVVKKIVIIVIAVALLCVGIFSMFESLSKKQLSGELHTIIDSLTFVIDENEVEMERLLAFEKKVIDLNYRDAALYYRYLVKLSVLKADSDSALKYFVDAQIQAELGEAYDIIAWMYADIAQVYIDFYTFEVAKECISTALLYAKDQEMDDFFYEYCHVIMAELSAQTGDIEGASEYLHKSLDWTADDLPEYQSMDQRRSLVLAEIALQTGNLTTCTKELESVETAINALEYPPMDILWISRIYYPYLEVRSKLALEETDFEGALLYMEELFATGTLYDQVSSLMNYLNEVILLLENIETDNMDQELQTMIRNYTTKLIVEYPSVFQNKNAMAGSYIHNSNMVTIAVFVQKYNIQNFYSFVIKCFIGVTFVILLLLWVWQESIRKGRIDGLTGAYSRKYYNQVLEDLKKGTSPYGIIMFDVDYFKQVNDNYGHEGGDLALKGISTLVIDRMDRNSKLFRFGGDEFCILCKHKTMEELVAIAEGIRVSVEKKQWNHPDMKVTLSIGVASSEDGEDIIEVVDANLYKSKEAGRNKVSW